MTTREFDLARKAAAQFLPPVLEDMRRTPPNIYDRDGSFRVQYKGRQGGSYRTLTEAEAALAKLKETL